MNKSKLYIALFTLGSVFNVACTDSAQEPRNPNTKTVVINNVSFEVANHFQFFTWDNLPTDVNYQREPLTSFKNVDGNTHYYEVVYVPSGNLNWFQAGYLADQAGGYLASITSEAENAFLFNLINDEKYFWQFPKYKEGSSNPNHHEIMIGPMIGGYQDDNAPPAEGWNWLSGEKWEYTNWAQNLDDGIIDKDPRNNTQPNDSGKEHIQRILGFGELNQPVPTWGDFSDDAGTYGKKRGGKRNAFIIEYNSKPES